jgi:hypothetical protein
MRQAQARKSFDAYLDAPRRSDRAHLHVVEDLRDEVPGLELPDLDTPRRERISRRGSHERAPVRVPAPDPAIESPDWALPFEDGRWDEALGGRPETDQENGRRTVVVTGRPGAQHRPMRERSAGATARQRRHTPTRARLAGRPDRVALWAVALGLIMAAMAGFTGGGHDHGSSSGAGSNAPAPVFDR